MPRIEKRRGAPAGGQRARTPPPLRHRQATRANPAPRAPAPRANAVPPTRAGRASFAPAQHASAAPTAPATRANAALPTPAPRTAAFLYDHGSQSSSTRSECPCPAGTSAMQAADTPEVDDCPLSANSPLSSDSLGGVQPDDHPVASLGRGAGSSGQPGAEYQAGYSTPLGADARACRSGRVGVRMARDTQPGLHGPMDLDLDELPDIDVDDTASDGARSEGRGRGIGARNAARGVRQDALAGPLDDPVQACSTYRDRLVRAQEVMQSMAGTPAQAASLPDVGSVVISLHLEDLSAKMQRIEALLERQQGVFNSAPQDKEGKRFRINKSAIAHVFKEQVKQHGPYWDVGLTSAAYNEVLYSAAGIPFDTPTDGIEPCQATRTAVNQMVRSARASFWKPTKRSVTDILRSGRHPPVNLSTGNFNDNLCTRLLEGDFYVTGRTRDAFGNREFRQILLHTSEGEGAQGKFLEPNCLSAVPLHVAACAEAFVRAALERRSWDALTTHTHAIRLRIEENMDLMKEATSTFGPLKLPLAPADTA